jgi:hypothetical protein
VYGINHRAQAFAAQFADVPLACDWHPQEGFSFVLPFLLWQLFGPVV